VGSTWETSRGAGFLPMGGQIVDASVLRDLTLTFAALHHLLTLLAVGDAAGARPCRGNAGARAA
jgi:hypothetical protein